MQLSSAGPRPVGVGMLPSAYVICSRRASVEKPCRCQNDIVMDVMNACRCAMRVGKTISMTRCVQCARWCTLTSATRVCERDGAGNAVKECVAKIFANLETCVHRAVTAMRITAGKNEIPKNKSCKINNE